MNKITTLKKFKNSGLRLTNISFLDTCAWSSLNIYALIKIRQKENTIYLLFKNVHTYILIIFLPIL